MMLSTHFDPRAYNRSLAADALTQTRVDHLPLDPATDGWADSEEFHANIVCNGCGEFHSDVVLCEGCHDVRGCSCLIHGPAELCGVDVPLCHDCARGPCGCPACRGGDGW